LAYVGKFIPGPIKRYAKQRQLDRRFPGLKCGDRCSISPRACINGRVTLGNAVNVDEDSVLRDSTLGTYSYVGRRSAIIHATVGKFCSIAPDVAIGLGRHPLAPFVSTHPAFVFGGEWGFSSQGLWTDYEPTTIGNDVWLGLRAAIKDGITVADGAVVAAGAVVTKDVPPYSIVAGVPARIIRYRFPPHVIQFLLQFRWWDRDEAWLRANSTKFHNIEEFINLFGSADNTHTSTSLEPTNCVESQNGYIGQSSH